MDFFKYKKKVDQQPEKKDINGNIIQPGVAEHFVDANRLTDLGAGIKAHYGKMIAIGSLVVGLGLGANYIFSDSRQKDPLADVIADYKDGSLVSDINEVSYGQASMTGFYVKNEGFWVDDNYKITFTAKKLSA